MRNLSYPVLDVPAFPANPDITLPNACYYDPKRNWSKLSRHLDDPELNTILVSDLNKYTMSALGKRFRRGDVPRDTEKPNMRQDAGKRGRPAGYLKYTRNFACHWLVNFNLRLISLTEPKRDWRIVTSSAHSTVWDGDQTLFDLNFFSGQFSAAECFARSCAYLMEPRQYLKTYRAKPEEEFLEQFWADVHAEATVTHC